MSLKKKKNYKREKKKIYNKLRKLLNKAKRSSWELTKLNKFLQWKHQGIAKEYTHDDINQSNNFVRWEAAGYCQRICLLFKTCACIRNKAWEWLDCLSC